MTWRWVKDRLHADKYLVNEREEIVLESSEWFTTLSDENARLIAAAPELLAALQQAAAALACFSTNTTGSMSDFAKEQFDKARAAIAKTEGK